jgi:hypothetical protein
MVHVPKTYRLIEIVDGQVSDIYGDANKILPGKGNQVMNEFGACFPVSVFR